MHLEIRRNDPLGYTSTVSIWPAGLPQLGPQLSATGQPTAAETTEGSNWLTTELAGLLQLGPLKLQALGKTTRAQRGVQWEHIRA